MGSAKNKAMIQKMKDMRSRWAEQNCKFLKTEFSNGKKKTATNISKFLLQEANTM